MLIWTSAVSPVACVRSTHSIVCDPPWAAGVHVLYIHVRSMYSVCTRSTCARTHAHAFGTPASRAAEAPWRQLRTVCAIHTEPCHGVAVAAQLESQWSGNPPKIDGRLALANAAARPLLARPAESDRFRAYVCRYSMRGYAHMPVDRCRYVCMYIHRSGASVHVCMLYGVLRSSGRDTKES